MKKCLSLLLALTMLFSLTATQHAFAADSAPSPEVTLSSEDNEIRPMGSLSGYGNYWYNSGSTPYGHFTVNVTGIAWTSAQLTLKIENFASNVLIRIDVYNSDGKKVYDTFPNYISMSNTDNWKNIKFTPGKTGTYKVYYSIYTTDNSTPSSGRINCWIY